jgi:hypothetical protein
MKPAGRNLVRPILVGVALWMAPAGFAGRDPSDAGDLIARVVAARQTIGYRVRARLVRTTAGSGQRDVKQLLIKGRRKGDDNKVLYQILWPSPLLGQTLVIEQTAGRDALAWLFTPPDHVSDLTPARTGDPFFGSDLTVEDLAEEFWHWPTQEIVGEDTVGQHRCRILESRPSADAATRYSRVRTWIAPEIALPLRVEKFGKDGRLIRRITAEKITKRKNNYWTAANVIVEPADGRTRTVLEGSHADRDIEISDEDFTVEKIKASLPSKP